LLCLNYFITLLQHVRGQSALCCQINVCMYPRLSREQILTIYCLSNASLPKSVPLRSRRLPLILLITTEKWYKVMWPIQLCHCQWPWSSFNVISAILSENKYILLFRSLQGGLTKDDIFDELEWPLKVIQVQTCQGRKCMS